MKEDIRLIDFSGKERLFLKEEWVFVDKEKGIAYKDDAHFDISEEEYQLIH